MFRTYKDLVRTPLKTKKSFDCADGFNCDKCDAGKYITETDVEIHKKADHWEAISQEMTQHKERFCTACMSLKPSYSELVSHIKSAHLFSSPTAKAVEREIFICNYCSNIFFNKKMLETHILYTHIWTSIQARKTHFHPCPKCDKVVNLKSLWFHFQLHELPSVSACDICLTNFPNKVSLFEHLKTHPFHYKCVICNFTTFKEDLFNSHLNDHKKKTYDRKKNIDKYVRKSFRRKIKDNIRFNIHNSLRGLFLPSVIDICTICREICTDKIDMEMHILRDHMGSKDEKKKRYMCSCGEEFFNKVLLKQHEFKMKGSHRSLYDGEEPDQIESNAMEDTTEIVLESYSGDAPIIVIETLDQDTNQEAVYETQ